MENNELDLNLDELDQIETNADNKLQVRNRFQQLANDKRTLAQEKEQVERERGEAQAKATQLEKELAFHKNFSQLSAKHPEAINFQDQILERVNKGMDAEEATVAVLFKEGKLNNQPPIQTQTFSPEGGSSINQLSEGDKSPNDMNVNDKLIALQELEKSGELAQALRAGINRS